MVETHCVELFLAAAAAVRQDIPMLPRSDRDKEYFAQDWFLDRLREANVGFQQQGRNSYPDFLVTAPGPSEGYEVKSLAFDKGRPARTDIDFNSTIPSGRKDGREVFLVFFLYTGRGKAPRHVHTVALAHGDLINADHLVAEEHVNVAVHGFGSYGDGFIRNRKMYVFPHPLTIDPEGLGKQRLIAPADWHLNSPSLRRVKTIRRTISAESVESYAIRLYGRGQAEVQRAPSQDAGLAREFDVFEMVDRTT